MKIKLINYTPNPLGTIVRAASICYDSVPREEIFDHLLKVGHLSPLEHVSFIFEIEGVSRALSHQLVRHRIASYGQRSQRYVDEQGFDVVLPPAIKDNEQAKNMYRRTMGKIAQAYRLLVDMGIPKEDARYLLPNACETKLVMTMNLRSLINFCSERLCGKAQWEIRKLAWLIKNKMYAVDPRLGECLRPKCIALGACKEEKGCGYFEK